MSDLTDNWFYSSAQRIWLCIRLNNAGKWACNRLTKDADFGKNNHLFTLNSFWSWRVCKQENCSIWGTESPHAYIEKLKHPKRVTVWCGFWSRGIIEPFFFENEQEKTATVNGDRYRVVMGGGYWQHLVSTRRRYVQLSRSYTRYFAPCFWRSHYQQQS